MEKSGQLASHVYRRGGRGCFGKQVPKGGRVYNLPAISDRDDDHLTPETHVTYIVMTVGDGHDVQATSSLENHLPNLDALRLSWVGECYGGSWLEVHDPLYTSGHPSWVCTFHHGGGSNALIF